MLAALIVEFHIGPRHIEDFAAALRENAMASMAAEPGCHYFDVCRDPADPALFFLYELYEDEEAIQAHLESGHFLAFSELTRDWIVRKTVRRMQRQ